MKLILLLLFVGVSVAEIKRTLDTSKLVIDLSKRQYTTNPAKIKPEDRKRHIALFPKSMQKFVVTDGPIKKAYVQSKALKKSYLKANIITTTENVKDFTTPTIKTTTRIPLLKKFSPSVTPKAINQRSVDKESMMAEPSNISEVSSNMKEELNEAFPTIEPNFEADNDDKQSIEPKSNKRTKRDLVFDMIVYKGNEVKNDDDDGEFIFIGDDVIGAAINIDHVTEMNEVNLEGETDNYYRHQRNVIEEESPSVTVPSSKIESRRSSNINRYNNINQ